MRLDISVDEARVVYVTQAIEHVNAHATSLGNWQRAALRDELVDALALKQLQHRVHYPLAAVGSASHFDEAGDHGRVEPLHRHALFEHQPHFIFLAPTQLHSNAPRACRGVFVFCQQHRAIRPTTQLRNPARACVRSRCDQHTLHIHLHATTTNTHQQ